MPETSSIPARRALLPRPTRSASLLLLLAIILELLGRLISSTGVTIAAAAALGAVLGDAALAPRIDGLSILREVPTRMTAGMPAMVRVTVTTSNRRRLATRPMVLVVTHPALPDGRVVTPRLSRGATAVVDVAGTPPVRGHWVDGGTVEVRAFSPLGGFLRHWTLHFVESTFVHPAPATPARLPDVMTAPAVGTSASARSGSGLDLFGVRDWRSGDPSGEIHWRATARRGQLVVREREHPAHTAIVVAAGASGAGHDWELAIARATATTVGGLRSGRSVVLLGAVDTCVPATVVEILDWYAALQSTAAPRGTDLQAALRQAGSGATLLWVAARPISHDLELAARGGGMGAVVSLTNPTQR